LLRRCKAGLCLAWIVVYGQLLLILIGLLLRLRCLLRLRILQLGLRILPGHKLVGRILLVLANLLLPQLCFSLLLQPGDIEVGTAICLGL